MATTKTATLARSESPIKGLHIGENTLLVNYTHGSNAADALTTDVITTFLLAKIPANAVVTSVESSVSGPANGTYDVAVGGQTIMTNASVTIGITRILVSAGLENATATASATATAWRYLRALVTPGTTTSSLQVTAVVRYLNDDRPQGAAGSG